MLWTYQRYHVDHGGIACHKEKESNLNRIGLFNVTWSQLIDNELADEVVLGLGHSLVNKISQIFEKLSAYGVSF